LIKIIDYYYIVTLSNELIDKHLNNF